MNKTAAQNHVVSGRALALLLEAKKDKDPNSWIIVVASYESVPKRSPEMDAWCALAVYKSSIEEVAAGSNLLRSKGGAVRIFETIVSGEAGDAYQDTDGTWLWSAD